MDTETITILVVDDDEDDYIIIRDLLAEVKEARYQLDWAGTYTKALELFEKKVYHVYMFDYRLDQHNGLELLREVINRGCRAPIILLTGQGDHEIDLEALKSGAADYLVKNDLRSSLLEHVIRYALERKKMEDELFQEKERAIVTLESIGDSVITTDTLGNITHLNQVAEKITGWSNAEARGMPFQSIIKIYNEVTRRPINDPAPKVISQNAIINFPSQTVIINRDNQEFAIEGTASPIRNRENQIIGIVIVMHDVTSTRELAKKMAYQASHDPLTGLYNRSIFEEFLQRLLNNAKNRHNEHVLLYLDLDRFKIVNDTCGHFAGDQLLKLVAGAMQQKIRQMDILARLGGDEFGIILTNCSFSKAFEIGEKIREAIQDIHFTWNEKIFSVEVSIGAVSINHESKNVDHILSIADQSCFMAKEKGGNRIHICLDNDTELLERRGEMQWITIITRAFEKNRFCLYYQPIIPIQKEGGRQRYEVLIRLLDDEGGVIPPSIFLPAAQRFNMMTAVDHWVIQSYFTFYDQNFRECPVDSIPICNINLSGSSLNDEFFLKFIKDQLKEHNVKPEFICFEITETIAINNYNKAIEFIKELKDLGCLFALDDFGSGLSSFNYLKHLPVDSIKIDGIFIQSLHDSPVDCTIVESINEIGHMMGIQTVAEFVENEEILKSVKRIGIDFVQGYWYSKPQPLEQLQIPK